MFVWLRMMIVMLYVNPPFFLSEGREVVMRCSSEEKAKTSATRPRCEVIDADSR